MARLGFRRVVAITALMGVLWGQGWYNHPELEWETFETEHFLIHFHQGTERSAREAATVAEKIYGPVTRMYQHEPAAKTHLIIKDVDDDSNGLAYFFDNKIEIWARPLDYDLRGSHRWMQDVITHEFVHIVQLATAMKFTSRVPSLYFQVIDYEDEKREDVLYGYPNVIASYAYPGVNIPPWFAEGVAQYMYPGANYDFWDTHRDMIVRDRVLNGNLLSLVAMNTFGKRGIGNESAYNQGFSFVSYLSDRFGVQVLEKISRRMSAPLSISISRAMKKATGSDGRQLYREWKGQLESRYDHEMTNVLAHRVTGDILIDKGTTNLHPVWHPSERKFAFLSNRAADFFGQTDLYIYDMETADLDPIATSAISAPSWSPDGKLLYYTRRSKPGKTGARWLDLFAYDLKTEEEERLTHGERATSPVPVGQGTVAYITVHDGTSNIRLLELSGGQPTSLTSFEGGEVIHSLTYHPGDSLLIFDATLNHGRQLFRVDLASGKVEAHHPDTPAPQSDGREPNREAGGDGLFISTDATGIFNLYWIGDDGDQGYVTNVPGGAFMPSVNAQGELLYSLYEQGGYKIAYLAHPEVLDPEKVGISTGFWTTRPGSAQEQPDRERESQPYLETMSKPFILPRITIDYGTVKPGFYFYVTEVLDRLL
ncbi:MAG: PD40 domain-containing protein, partial [Candidatus Marinimicrobia bacterium]|nr:PD40 domain-containing protein [Candidatus Neomarinimicrobiota bacterium]